MQLETSAAEIAARVVAGLIDMAEQRAELMAQLSDAVRLAVDDADPDHLRDTQPTWLQDRPAWIRLDPLDRVRLAHDRLLVLEIQAREIVMDLRGMLALRPVGSPERPVGYTPARAHRESIEMAGRRAEILSELVNAERRLRASLQPVTSERLRKCIRALQQAEKDDTGRLARLSALQPEARFRAS